jgi:hypothetical protein
MPQKVKTEQKKERYEQRGHVAKETGTEAAHCGCRVTGAFKNA